jgi:hypothetical protein
MIASPTQTRPMRYWPGAFPAVVFLALSTGDLLFSLKAFALGYSEGNPFLALLLERGLFLPGKILLSLTLAALILVIFRATNRYGWVIWSGVTLMAGVNLIHIVALSRHL